MKQIFKNKYLRYTIIVVVLLFATEGFILTASYFAIKMHLFNDPGAVDFNDRYFQDIAKADELSKNDTSNNNISRIAKFYQNLNILNYYYPYNAMQLNKAYLMHEDIWIAEKMFSAVRLELIDSTEFNNDLKSGTVANPNRIKSDKNVFEWMNIIEWEEFKIAVKRDSAVIDSVSRVVKIEPRLIVAMLLGEQMRLFNSKRETVKTVINPLKILSVETKFSLGVTGIKEETAKKTERFLKDSSSEFYLGKNYEHLLDFSTADTATERYNRLINSRNHYYSYLYAALIVKQIREQWLNAGFDISYRPEILATLYNLGYIVSKPKANPSVGGSKIMINGKHYTFGSLAYEFYYSGELMNLFPYKINYW